MKQRDPEWLAHRAPRITVSRLVDVVAGPKTKRHMGYKQEIIDALAGVPPLEDDKPWYEHGKRLEPEGSGRYEWETGNDIIPIALVTHPEHDFVCGSPDGLIGSDGGVELKCHISYKQFRKIETKGMPSHYKPQVQGYLWITGRKWWDYCSYYSNHGRTFIYIQRIEPDLKYHNKLERKCLEFWFDIQEGVK